jgi:hypothetical protein
LKQTLLKSAQDSLNEYETCLEELGVQIDQAMSKLHKELWTKWAESELTTVHVNYAHEHMEQLERDQLGGRMERVSLVKPEALVHYLNDHAHQITSHKEIEILVSQSFAIGSIHAITHYSARLLDDGMLPKGVSHYRLREDDLTLGDDATRCAAPLRRHTFLRGPSKSRLKISRTSQQIH